jgi:FkbM family methyltransferase
MTAPDRLLIYDVGMHDGADSAYYLNEGYRVVALEANPVFAEQAARRFAQEIDQGRLTVLNVGIAPGEGTARFWVCDDRSDWSSFHRAIAAREGAAHHPIEVPLMPFGEVLERYGVPYYCKVDIEGNDHLCLAAMTPDRRPPFVSIELSPKPLLERLRELGYDRFKVIHQLSFTCPNRALSAVKACLPHQRLKESVEWANRLARRRRDGDWRFAVGSSGPLPERTRGRWLSHLEARRLCAELDRARRSGRAGRNDWFDLHATTRAALSRYAS